MAGKVLLGLAATAIIGSIYVTPSYADNGHNRGKKYDNRGYEHRGPEYNRSYRGGHGRWHDRGGYRYYQDGYSHRIYAPPPVFYTPPPEPGVRIFFPPVYINP
jgi:hypothetical protein